MTSLRTLAIQLARSLVKKATDNRKAARPPQKPLPLATINGETTTVHELCGHDHTHYMRAYNRIKKGVPVEEAIALGQNKVEAPTYTHDGKSLTLRQWSAETGVNLRTLRSRVGYGWRLEDALTRPIQEGTDKIEFNGESLLIKTWSKKTGINVHTLRSRLKDGWSTEAALTTPAKKRPPTTT